MEPHRRWLKELVGNDAPVVRYSTLLGRTQILVLDHEIVEEILTAPAGKDTARFQKPFFFLPEIIGKGLVTLEGEEWVKQRRIIQPSFSVAYLKESLETSVPGRVEKFVDLWKKAGEKREIDVASHLSALTLDVIGETGFSHDFQGLKDIEEWANVNSEKPELSDPLILAMTNLLKPSLLRVFLYVIGLQDLDGIANPVTKKAKTEVNRTVDNILRFAKEKLTANDGTSSSKRSKSVLQLLFNARDAESTSGKAALTDEELRDEIKTMILAGHETTSTWCHWALYALSKWPDVQEKLYQEVTKVAPTSTDRITIEDVEKMDYLNAFLNETLRLFPPVGMLIRQNQYNERIAGHEIPPETMLVIPIHLIHRHPKYWKQPDEFVPERWLNDEKVSKGGGGLETFRFTFLPFGAGGHACIGYRFAQLEAKLIMANIVRSLRVEIAPSQRDVEHTFTTIVTMKSKPPLKIVVKSR